MTGEVNREKVGLVLSGGGASASYQAGAVKALSELGVRIHAVAGASAGALNGSVVAEADGDLGKAADDLERLWRSFIYNSPIDSAIVRILARAPNPFVAAALIAACEPAGLLGLAPADVASLEKTMDRGMKRILRGEGLPLYVSILESEGIRKDREAVVGKLSDLWDTPPAQFRHVQSLPKDERKAAVLAAAAVPILLQARRLGPDARRYMDGGLGGWRERQGNTPAAPLVEDAGCTHLIVVHSSDGSPWRRDRFPDTATIEIHPRRTMKRKGEPRDTFCFSSNIPSWIEQGYEDAMRCVGNAKNALDLVHRGREARMRRDRAVDALDSDGFGRHR